MMGTVKLHSKNVAIISAPTNRIWEYLSPSPGLDIILCPAFLPFCFWIRAVSSVKLPEKSEALRWWSMCHYGCFLDVALGLAGTFPFCLFSLRSTSHSLALHSTNLGRLLIPVQYGSGPLCLWIKISLSPQSCWTLFPHCWPPISPACSADLSVQTKPLSLMCLKILG